MNPLALVIDAPATIAWMLGDERDDFSKRSARRVAEHGALVPALWRWEVQNVLSVAERRGRINESQSMKARALLQLLPITMDQAPMVFGRESALARRHGLSIYDAAYLELAIRSGCKLATKDAKLAGAAQDHGLLFR